MHVTLRDDIEKLTPALRRFARALVAHEPDDAPDTADQLVQDALARAWRSELARAVGDPRCFLYSAITMANRHRMRGRTSAHGAASGASEQMSPAAHGTASGRTASAFAHAGMRRHGVTHALDAMNLEDREAFLLVVLEGLTYTEACDVLAIPRTTLVTRLLRARQHLDAVLEAPANADHRPRRPNTHLRVVK